MNIKVAAFTVSEKSINTIFICHVCLYNCAYFTFDLTVTINRNVTLGIYPYIVSNSPMNNYRQEAEH